MRLVQYLIVEQFSLECLFLVECSHFTDLPSLPPVSPQQLGEGRGELCKGGGEAGRRARGTRRKEK